MARRTESRPVTLDPEVVRALASWPARDGLVVSLVLDVDGRRFPRKGDYETHLAGAVRRARAALAMRQLPKAVARAAESDLERVAAYITREFERGDIRGVAVFASTPAGLWQVFHLPRSVGTRLVLDAHPHVLRLEALLANAERIALALISRDRARIFTSILGRATERTEVTDEVPGRHDQGGRSQTRFARHIEELMHRHLRHTADVLFALSRREPFEHLVLAGPDEVTAEFSKELHVWLAERVAARVALPMTAGIADVRAAFAQIEDELEAERAAGVVERLRDETGSARLGAVGIDAAIAAVTEGRAETLVFSDLQARSGSRCRSCGRLSLPVAKCPDCGATPEPVQDLIEELVDDALRHRCRVLPAPPGAVSDGIGVLLRY